MVHRRFETLILEPLSELESIVIIEAAQQRKWEVNVNSAGRIITISGPKTVKPIVRFMADMGLGPDVGVIKEITEYEPDEFEKDFMEIIGIIEIDPEE